MLNFDEPGERKVANLPQKEPQKQSAPEGGRKEMKIMMVMIRTLMIITCFLD